MIRIRMPMPEACGSCSFQDDVTGACLASEHTDSFFYTHYDVKSRTKIYTDRRRDPRCPLREVKSDNVDGFEEGMMSVRNGVWHDVKLDPPKEAGSYLVATDRGAVTISRWYPPMEIGGILREGKFGGYHGRITHWMDRPESPKK